jgi:hypothetical protein
VPISNTVSVRIKVRDVGWAEALREKLCVLPETKEREKIN